MKKPIHTKKLQVAGETIRDLVPEEIKLVGGGGRNPKPNPSGQISCSGSAHC